MKTCVPQVKNKNDLLSTSPHPPHLDYNSPMMAKEVNSKLHFFDIPPKRRIFLFTCSIQGWAGLQGQPGLQGQVEDKLKLVLEIVSLKVSRGCKGQTENFEKNLENKKSVFCVPESSLNLLNELQFSAKMHFELKLNL